MCGCTGELYWAVLGAQTRERHPDMGLLPKSACGQRQSCQAESGGTEQKGEEESSEGGEQR